MCSLHRSIKLPERVGAVIPLEGSTNILAATGKKLCILDRETGMHGGACFIIDHCRKGEAVNWIICAVWCYVGSKCCFTTQCNAYYVRGWGANALVYIGIDLGSILTLQLAVFTCCIVS